MRLLLLASLCLPLFTTGCFVGDGMAHMVKLASKNLNSSGDSEQAQAPQPAPEVRNAPVERDPAPQPAAAPRDQIRVEELGPPKG